MKLSLLALAGLVLLAACSKVNQENFAKVDTVITVRFVNGKVALKTFDKPGAPQK